MPTVTLPDSDEPVEVEASQIHYSEGEAPEGFVSASNHQAAIQSRVERTKRDTRKALRNDEEWLRDNFSDAFGVDLREDGRPSGSPTDDELQKLRRKAAEADDLKATNESLAQNIADAREERLENTILRSADGVKESLKNPFVREVKSRFEWDDSEGAFVTKQDDGSPGYVVEDGGSRLAGPPDVIEKMREESPDFFEDQSARGTGFRQSSSQQRSFSEEEIAAMSPEQYAANREAIKNGK